MDYTRAYFDLLKSHHELMAENERLRALFGMSMAAPDESDEPPVEPVSPPLGKVHNNSSPTEKIDLFMSLFRGRNDVYAKQWHSEKTQKSGYSPVCANEWIPGICDKRKYKCNMTASVGGDNDNLHAVMIYQSMSGDADVGHSSFSMNGGSLTSLNGDTFYVTNTSCEINLSGVQITGADGALLRVSSNDSSRGWGKSGANGGTCILTASDMALEGEVVVDAISSLNMAIESGCDFTGTINPDGDAGTVNVTLEDGASWTLTADAHVTSFGGDMQSVVRDGYTLYVDGTVAS